MRSYVKAQLGLWVTRLCGKGAGKTLGRHRELGAVKLKSNLNSVFPQHALKIEWQPLTWWKPVHNQIVALESREMRLKLSNMLRRWMHKGLPLASCFTTQMIIEGRWRWYMWMNTRERTEIHREWVSEGMRIDIFFFLIPSRWILRGIPSQFDSYSGLLDRVLPSKNLVYQ